MFGYFSLTLEKPWFLFELCCSIGYDLGRFCQEWLKEKTPLKLAREKLKLKTWLDSGQHRSPFLELVLPDLTFAINEM